MGNQYSAWSEQEISILREKAGKVRSSEIGKEIGRGSSGVQKMAKKSGLPPWQPPVKERPVPVPKPPKPAKEVKDVQPRPVPIAKPVVAPVPLRKPEKKRPVIHSQLEWCQNCHSAVSNWSEHVSRMSHMGCRRPAA
jgi:hypothetical protein